METILNFSKWIECLNNCRKSKGPTSACLRHTSRFLRWALEKWSQAFCLEAAWNTDTICSTVAEDAGASYRPERERAGGKEQRSEKVESGRKALHCMFMLMCFQCSILLYSTVCSGSVSRGGRWDGVEKEPTISQGDHRAPVLKHKTVLKATGGPDRNQQAPAPLSPPQTMGRCTQTHPLLLRDIDSQ